MVEQLEYNTERPKLHLSEYGRHIQKMVDYIKTVEDKAQRNKLAKSIIAVMGNLNPHLRDVPDFQPMLWDQLFIIANFELDVDSPFPIPTKEQLMEKPEPLEYPQNFPKYRFYGNNIKRMIDEAIKWEEGDKKDALIFNIANHMKKSYLNWNKDTVEDEVIFEHLFELSNGNINLKETNEDLSQASELIKSNKKFMKNTNVKKNYKNKGRKRY